MVQQIEGLRDEVRCRMGVDLAELANDQNVTRDGWIRCIRAASDFEDAVEVILNDAWIPNSLPQLTAFLICITDNIRKTRANVDFADRLFISIKNYDNEKRVFLRYIGTQTRLSIDRQRKYSVA